MSEQRLPDVVALMADIRSRVMRDIESQGGGELANSGTMGSRGAGSVSAAAASGGLLNSEDLRAINRCHAFSSNLNADSIKSHRPGPIGALVVALKRRCLQLLRDSLLQDYLNSEREFHAHLVRHINSLTRELEERSATIRRLEARMVTLEADSKS